MIFAGTYWPWILGIFFIAALLWLSLDKPKEKGSSFTEPLDKDWLEKLMRGEEDDK